MHPIPLTYSLWSGRPPPESGEVLSSWFTRIALSNGLSPKELYSICAPGTHLFQVDLDRFPNRQLIKKLSSHTAVPVSQITEMTLSKYHGRVFEDQSAKSRLAWIPPANVSIKSFGQQLCPHCLNEDTTPYLRHFWRLAFITICPIHRNLLLDRCKECGKPISLLKLSQHQSLNQCFECGAVFSDAAETTIKTEATLKIQSFLLKVAQGEWPKLGEKHVHPILYFKILHHLFRLLGCSQFATGLQGALGYRKLDIPKFKDIERYNTRCRNILINLAMSLLKKWPFYFVDTCRSAGISRYSLLKVKFDLPFEFISQIDKHLGIPFFKISAEDIECAATYLKTKGIEPTRMELEKLLNFRFSKSHKFPFKKAINRIPSGQSRYWKLDGVSPEVKEAAKKAAKHAGEKTGPWVENVLRKELNRRYHE